MSPIVMVFQFFVIAPRLTPSKYKDIAHSVLQCCIFVLTIVTFLYNPEPAIWQSFDLTSRVTLKIVLASYAVAIFEGIATKGRQLKIIEQLCKIDELISAKFCADFDDYRGIKKRYMRSVWGVFLGLVAIQIFHWICFNKASLLLCIAWSYAHFGISVRLLQNAFYVDMIFERLCILHQELLKLKRDCCTAQQQLSLAGDIYGKLWMMTNDINFSFGWSLLAIVLECVVDLVNEIFVMYSSCDSLQCFNTLSSNFFQNSINYT